jgi:hypothetical protein
MPSKDTFLSKSCWEEFLLREFSTKAESIGVDESGLGRMLGYGSVVIRGAGGELSKLSAGLLTPTN